MKSEIPEGWKEVRLGDVINLRRGHDLTRKNMNNNGNYSVIGSNGIIGMHDKFKLEGPVVTVGRSGNVGTPFYCKEDAWPHNTTLYIDNFKGNNPYYIYFLLMTLNLKNYAGGSAVPTLNRNHIHPILINLAPEVEQQSIADTLSSLDKKIELNNKINENLEEQAQAIFKHWFVDFEFPDKNGKPYKSSGGKMVESELGMIPKGWGIKELRNYAEVKSGYAFKSSYWKEEGIKVLKIANISTGKLMLDGCSYVDQERIPKEKRYIAYPGDLLIALTGATLGKMAIIPKLEETLLVNQRVGKFVYNKKFDYPLPFLYCLLKTENITSEIIDRGQGSAQPNISPNSLGSINFLSSSKELINQFNIRLKPFFEDYIYSYKQNQILSQLRDTLLPKLMSGEIRIPLD